MQKDIPILFVVFSNWKQCKCPPTTEFVCSGVEKLTNTQGVFITVKIKQLHAALWTKFIKTE